MKKQLFLSVLALIATAGSLMAQNGMQQKAPNERTKETLLKLQTDISLSYDQSAKAYPIFENFYTEQQNAMEEMRASGSMDREKMKEKRDELAAKRDDQLKIIFTEGQMKKWKTDVEPSMRPQRKSDDQKQ